MPNYMNEILPTKIDSSFNIEPKSKVSLNGTVV